MIYLDTGCLVKLYYPEPDSAAVAARVSNRTICYTELHSLELANALELKVFRKEATAAQVLAVTKLIQDDILAGVLIVPVCSWPGHWEHAVRLSKQHTAGIGARSLDVLHCALAADLQALEFITTVLKQSTLAKAMGLPWSPL
jgi:predicted nucleic acid-binding protein